MVAPLSSPESDWGSLTEYSYDEPVIEDADAQLPKTLVAKDKIRQSKKPRPTLQPEDLPEKQAHSFQNPFTRCRVADAYLQSAMKGKETIEVDFDIMVAGFLQETAGMNPKPGDIPFSSDKIIKDFAGKGPFVGRQNDLLTFALHIQAVVKKWDEDRTKPKPFALRYRNLAALKKLTIKRSKSLTCLPDNEAVVLVDLYGRVLAFGLPPKPPGQKPRPPKPPGKAPPRFPSGEDRALTALTGSAKLHHLRKFCGPTTKTVLSGASVDSKFLNSPFTDYRTRATGRLSRAASQVVNFAGGTYGRLGYQAFGYGQGAETSGGMSDTVMKWLPDRQGMPGTVRPTNISQNNLASVIQMGEEAAFKRMENARVTEELLWQYEISRALIIAIQPETYAAAMRCTEYIAAQTGPLLAERIKKLHNPLLPGRMATWNTQVPFHRDGANSNLMDSVYFLGRHYRGGRFILSQLGYSFCGNHGYSVHGLYRILEHGVSHIMAEPTSELAPLRISLALYSHADVFAGAAKLSAASSGDGSFSDRSMWLPFTPPDFSVSDFRARLAREERAWYKKAKAASKNSTTKDTKEES